MSRAATVHVPAGMLTWGRDRAHVDLKDAAAKIKRDESELADWESGTDPPLTALRDMAALYGLPLSAFLLSTPKKEPAPPVDRRTQAGVDSPRTNSVLARALNNAIGLQSLAEDLHDALDIEPFMVTAGENVDAEWVAAQERAALGITVGEQLGWDGEDAAFKNWRLAIERRGIYVLQRPLRDSGVRAFSVHGDPPLIVVHRSDWPRAKLFSLAHELGHVVIGSSGICDPFAPRPSGIERWCNEFADSLLLPRDMFLKDRDVLMIRNGGAPTETVLRRIGNRFKVSPGVVWYRLMQTKSITQSVFSAGWDRWRVWMPPPEQQSGGGSTSAEVAVRDNGVMLPDLMLRASKKGLLGDADLSQYLAMRADAVQALEREVATRLGRV